MNKPVPNWCVAESSTPMDILTLATALSNSTSLVSNQTLPEYATELTWRNGILGMRATVGTTTPCVPINEQPSASWDRLESSGGTLESVVEQAARIPRCSSNNRQSNILNGAGDEFVQWLGERHRSPPATTPPGLTMDAVVPCSHNLGDVPSQINSDHCKLGCTHTYERSMDSCSATSVAESPFPLFNVGTTVGQSVSRSAASWVRETQQLTLDARDRELVCSEHHSPSLDSLENTSYPKQYTKTMDEHDFPCHSRNERNRAEEENGKSIGKSCVTIRRGRIAASHNQSERKRRDRFNQRMKTLQKLVPNSSKIDKASILDEVIENLKQLQAQLNLINLNFPTTMMAFPFAMQHLLPMPMMDPMRSLGLGMNMMNSISMDMPSVLHLGAFMPPTSLNDFMVVDSVPIAAATNASSYSSAVVDPLTAFIQYQPMNMDAFTQMSARNFNHHDYQYDLRLRY